MDDHVYHGDVSKCPEKKSTKGTSCFAINCKSYHNKDFRNHGITFHKFPSKTKEPIRYGEWVKNCRRTICPSSSSVLCSQHFMQDCIDRTGQIVRLKEGAVPILFDIPQHLQNVMSKQRDTKTSKRAGAPLMISDAVKQPKLETCLPAMDHQYSLEASPSKIKNRFRKMQDRIRDIYRQNINLKAREKRAKLTCKHYMKRLSEQNLVSEDLKQKLENYKGSL